METAARGHGEKGVPSPPPLAGKDLLKLEDKLSMASRCHQNSVLTPRVLARIGSRVSLTENDYIQHILGHIFWYHGLESRFHTGVSRNTARLPSSQD